MSGAELEGANDAAVIASLQRNGHVVGLLGDGISDGAPGFVPLPALYWPILALMVLAYLALMHIMKVWFRRLFGPD